MQNILFHSFGTRARIFISVDLFVGVAIFWLHAEVGDGNLISSYFSRKRPLRRRFCSLATPVSRVGKKVATLLNSRLEFYLATLLLQ